MEYLPHELVPQISVLKYSIVDVRCTNQNGRQFVVEMQMLWLRFMTEIEDSLEEIPEELLQNSIIKEAVDYLQESGFTKGELATCGKYWDDIRSEMILMNAAKAESVAEGRTEEIIEMIKRAIKNGLDNELIKTSTGLTGKEINDLRN